MMSTDTNVERGYRIWRSGDDLLLTIGNVSFELSRDAALALAAEIADSYASKTRQGYSHLTAEERAEVCRLYQEDGLGVAAIARQMGIKTPNALYQILHRAGIRAHDKKRSALMKRIRAQKRAA
jgi:hypothetical protein